MFTQLAEKISCLAKKILSFVNDAPISAEEKNRLLHYSIFLVIGLPTMHIFGIYNFFKSNYLLSTLIFISSSEYTTL